MLTMTPLPDGNSQVKLVMSLSSISLKIDGTSKYLAVCFFNSLLNKSKLNRNYNNILCAIHDFSFVIFTGTSY